MRIRIDGTRAEIIDALFHLRLHFTVYAVSRAYPDRARPHQQPDGRAEEDAGEGTGGETTYA